MASVEQQTPAGANGAAQDIAVENPATGQVIGHVPDLGPEQVADLARRGRAAQPAWEALGFEGRGRVLRRAQRWLTENSDRVIDTIVAETGKAWEDAQAAELAYGAGAFGFWAKHAPEYLADEKVRSSSIFVAGKRLVLRYRPLGLVGVIGPWNYPLTNSFGDCIPALAAGNSVILKPSELTPLTSLLLAEGLRASGLPEDVFSVATGRGPTGEALIDAVDMIMFTGSTDTGRKVMTRAAQTLTPVALELGGKDPMVVLSDADLERAANAAVYYSMLNTGQTCISIERVYVEAPIYDAFVARVTEKARALRHGMPAGPGSIEVGSMTFGRAGRRRRAPRRGRARPRRARRRRRPPRGPARPLVRADRPARRRPGHGDHARGDVRTDAADHEGRRRGRGGADGQRLAVRARARRSTHATSRAARRSRGGSRRAPCASTTRCSTTTRSSCRWAGRRRRGWATATAPAASASSRSTRRC